jgi:ubiquinone/menaquinone biosynthesis C-methylase UbiE
MPLKDEFSKFEHEGWERVAGQYDSVWSSSTRQFIPFLLAAAEVGKDMAVLDIGCGPGYVAGAASQRGAAPVGLDFSAEMIGIARQMFPQIEFREGDAQKLPYGDASFDRVVANFALLHVSDPARVCAEVCRVLKPGGKFAFTAWAPPEFSPYAKIIDDALEAHADMTLQPPAGPPHYLFNGKEGFRAALERAGFDGESMNFAIQTIRWRVPTARFAFDAERNAGVRTAGLLALQSSERLEKIRIAIEEAVQPYAETAGGFALPKGAYVVGVGKKS